MCLHIRRRKFLLIVIQTQSAVTQKHDNTYVKRMFDFICLPEFRMRCAQYTAVSIECDVLLFMRSKETEKNASLRQEFQTCTYYLHMMIIF
jgi:hypothetical protein